MERRKMPCARQNPAIAGSAVAARSRPCGGGRLRARDGPWPPEGIPIEGIPIQDGITNPPPPVRGACRGTSLLPHPPHSARSLWLVPVTRTPYRKDRRSVSDLHGFELLREQRIAELNSTARLFRHAKS